MKKKLHYRIPDRLGYDLRKKTRKVHAFIEKHVGLLLERHMVNCVLDLCANGGQYSKSLRDAGYEGRIVSFEPVAASFATLKKACAKYQAWRCYNFALGRRPTHRDHHPIPRRGVGALPAVQRLRTPTL